MSYNKEFINSYKLSTNEFWIYGESYLVRSQLKDERLMSLPVIRNDSGLMFWANYTLTSSGGVFIRTSNEILETDFVKLLPCPGMIIKAVDYNTYLVRLDGFNIKLKKKTVSLNDLVESVKTNKILIGLMTDGKINVASQIISHTNNFVSIAVKCYCKDFSKLPIRHAEDFIKGFPVDNDNEFKKYIVIGSTENFELFQKESKMNFGMYSEIQN